MIFQCESLIQSESTGARYHARARHDQSDSDSESDSDSDSDAVGRMQSIVWTLSAQCSQLYADAVARGGAARARIACWAPADPALDQEFRIQWRNS